MSGAIFANLDDLAAQLRSELESKKYILLYAYNGTGKTRLSMAFKEIGKQETERDTLYFNAFTEDLFTWDNDLDGDSERVLKINSASHFFDGLAELAMETRIRPFLHRYADFDFSIDYVQWTINFSREIQGETLDHIKVSRGEENIFIWCFFLAIVQLAMDGAEAYQWVKYIYIDDPISSLDEHNAIAVANNVAQLFKRYDRNIKIVISTHHALFYNVLHNELKKAKKYFMKVKNGKYELREQNNDTPFFLHVSMLADLDRAEKSDQLYTYHFTILRSILEKSASFHGFPNFAELIKRDEDDPDGILHARLINILSHGNYSLYEPREMVEENKTYFRKILSDLRDRFNFNPKIFSEE